jgi:large subunit ribosomal protein L1
MILIKDLKKIKPSSSKGNYFKKITLSSTMGISTILDINSIEM